MPLFAHLPLIVDMQGRKLSKWLQDASVASFRDKGYLPESLLNSVAILGWTPPSHENPSSFVKSAWEVVADEFLTMEDLKTYFMIQKVSKSPAQYDEAKFWFWNSQHIKRFYEYYNESER